VERGLLGPQEAARVWDRHLLNCAVVEALLPADARVVDVGSGAGLPGLALACARPDLHIDLVESLARRVTFLDEAVTALNLDGQVGVVRGRAEDRAVVGRVGAAPWVTARAVAPLERLARWCLPLLRPGGSLLALKGSQAAAEIDSAAAAIRRYGGGTPRIVSCGDDVVSEPTTVVVIDRQH
jgi:16S rRNA (guanine527-N7)-methyltransferase